MFATPGGLYQYTVLPFGVHSAPATFQRMMDRLLRPHRDYAAYIDANPAKCHLGLEEASYLGYQVGRGNVQPQEIKVKTILDWPRPTTKKQVKSFLGLVRNYQSFIPGFATLASPLHDLTWKTLPDRVTWLETRLSVVYKLIIFVCSKT